MIPNEPCGKVACDCCRYWRREEQRLHKRMDDLENQIRSLNTVLSGRDKRLAVLTGIVDAACSVCSEDSVRSELQCYNMGVELLNRLAKLSRGSSNEAG